jgi:plasmid maintenance system antidote protein VapI
MDHFGTQIEMAKALDIDKGYVSILENGRYPVTKGIWQRLAEHLGVDCEVRTQIIFDGTEV